MKDVRFLALIAIWTRALAQLLASTLVCVGVGILGFAMLPRFHTLMIALTGACCAAISVTALSHATALERRVLGDSDDI